MAKLITRKAPQKPKQVRPVRHYVKEWRMYRDLSQEQLAGRIERSRGLISQIETGETALTEDTIYALADALQCDPGDILRVNPLKEGIVVDITDAIRHANPDIQAQTLGFVRGLLAKQGS